jgi:hypothetical protein
MYSWALATDRMYPNETAGRQRAVEEWGRCVECVKPSVVCETSCISSLEGERKRAGASLATFSFQTASMRDACPPT